MTPAEREQAALVALRDALGESLGWITQCGTTRRGGVSRMTIDLEPTIAPIVVATLIAALKRQAIDVRPVRARPGIAVRAIHTPTGVELDLAIKAKLSYRLRRHFERTLGRSWKRRLAG